MKNKAINIILITAVLAIIIIVLFFKKGTPLKELPYYGEKHIDTLTNGEIKESYHKVGDFNFINQEGKTVSQKNFAEKIYVTDYFFTTCKSICPVMTNQMQRVYEEFINEPGVCFLSHTVDPETDSVQVLAEYAQAKNINSEKWHFVTGDKKELYDMARKGYYLDAEQGDGGPDDFIHTPNFALIDVNKYIRGYYDGTDSAEVEMLIKDIRILLSANKQ